MNASFDPLSAGLRPREGALGPYLRAIRAHKLLVILVTLAAVAGSVLWLQVRDPSYEATAQLLVTPVPDDNEDFLNINVLRDTGDPTRNVQTAATLVESPRAAQLAAERLGPDWSADGVLGAVDVEPEGESNILSITASADEAGLAARVANTFADAALDERNDELRRQVRDELSQLEARQEQLEDPSGVIAAENAGRIDRLESVLTKGDPSISDSRAASPPADPSGPGPLLIIPLSLVAGLALAGGSALLLELIDRTIRDEEEAVSLYPLPVLVRVPKLRERQLRRPESVGWFMPPSVREAFRTVLAQLENDPNERRMLMVTSPSSGDGKTTSAVNLSVSLAAAGHSVVLMDLDTRKPDVATLLGVEPTGSTLGALLGPDLTERFPELLVSAPQIPTLKLLTTGGLYGETAILDVLHRRLPELLGAASRHADYVVIDTPPLGEVSDALRVAYLSDGIILAVRPGTTNRRGFAITRDLLERAGRTPIGYLVVGAERETGTYYGYGLQAARGNSIPTAASQTRAPGRAADYR